MARARDFLREQPNVQLEGTVKVRENGEGRKEGPSCYRARGRLRGWSRIAEPSCIANLSLLLAAPFRGSRDKGVINSMSCHTLFQSLVRSRGLGGHWGSARVMEPPQLDPFPRQHCLIRTSSFTFEYSEGVRMIALLSSLLPARSGRLPRLRHALHIPRFSLPLSLSCSVCPKKRREENRENWEDEDWAPRCVAQKRFIAIVNCNRRSVIEPDDRTDSHHQAGPSETSPIRRKWPENRNCLHPLSRYQSMNYEVLPK